MLALAAADRAVRAAPDLLEARFNLALALEKALLVGQAQAAWTEYLNHERQVEWSEEARARLKALDHDTQSADWQRSLSRLEILADRHDVAGIRGLAARSPQSARLYAEETLLPRWAEEQFKRKPSEAARALWLARSLGEVLAAVHGDRMTADSVAVIDGALASGHPDLVEALIDGHRAFANGLELLRNQRHREALVEFIRAAGFLETGRSPFSLWAHARAGFCEFYLGQPDLAERLNALSQRFDSGRYPNLAGRLSALRGMANGRVANLAESFRLYQEALSRFERTGETEHIAAVNFMIAENLRFQGETILAWDYRHTALKLARDFGSSIYIHNALLDSAEAALKEGYPEVALRFYEEMLSDAVPARDALGAVETLLRRSRAHQQAGHEQAAVRDLAQTDRWMAILPAGDRRQRLQADIARAEGEIAVGARPRDAVRTLSTAIMYAEGQQERFRLPQLHWARARAFLALGNLPRAQEDLEQGLAEFEAQRATILDQQLQASYFDQAQAVFDDLIYLQQVRNKRPREAFETAERYRNRIFVKAEPAGRLGFPNRAVFTVPALQEQLPPGVVLLEYEVLADRLLVWVVARDRFETISVPVDRAGLRKRVRRLRTLLRDAPDSRRLRPALEDLYTLLIGSLNPSIEKNETLIIVPDKELQAVPFAALFNAKAQKYLIQDHAIGYAPSAKLLVGDGRRRETGSGMPGSALVMAATAFDRTLFHGLDDLPAAEEEAQSIAALYDRKVLLTGIEATKRKFLAEAPLHEIVHFAGHARINTEYPLLSALIFAPDRTQSQLPDNGILSAKEIYGLRLPYTRLVVLAGCDTASGDLSTSEGLGNLVGPFLATGVPGVLGSLWKVEDRVAQEFFVGFYRSLRSGDLPLAALRETQARFIAGADPSLRSPARWAAFEVVGTVRSFR